MSSCEVRKSMLDHFLGGCPRGWCPNNPYVVGVTGGIAASRKRTAVREVQSTFGAAVFDCDKLIVAVFIYKLFDSLSVLDEHG